MTQGQLAKRVHLTTSAINAIETGKSKPSFDTALNLAAVFGVPVEEVFSYVEVPA